MIEVMAYRYRPAITCVNLVRATVTKAKSLDSPKIVKKRTHCRDFAGGITPVGHGYERSTQENKMGRERDKGGRVVAFGIGHP
jgi:hypothetical protein